MCLCICICACIYIICVCVFVCVFIQAADRKRKADDQYASGEGAADILSTFDPYQTNVYKGVFVGGRDIADESFVEPLAKGQIVQFKKRKGKSGGPTSVVKVAGSSDDVGVNSVDNVIDSGSGGSGGSGSGSGSGSSDPGACEATANIKVEVVHVDRSVVESKSSDDTDSNININNSNQETTTSLAPTSSVTSATTATATIATAGSAAPAKFQGMIFKKFRQLLIVCAMCHVPCDVIL